MYSMVFPMIVNQLIIGNIRTSSCRIWILNPSLNLGPRMLQGRISNSNSYFYGIYVYMFICFVFFIFCFFCLNRLSFVQFVVPFSKQTVLNANGKLWYSWNFSMIIWNGWIQQLTYFQKNSWKEENFWPFEFGMVT